jgi:fatty acid desaturase (delta-4 desaturase)
MPPNANVGSTLRNRAADKAIVDDADPPTESTIRSLKGLKGNEIAIEGVIYDIAQFVHPGGNVIKFFGGNDVTVQYKMIHPYHTVKHMEKMKVVGRVCDYEPEYVEFSLRVILLLPVQSSSRPLFQSGTNLTLLSNVR